MAATSQIDPDNPECSLQIDSGQAKLDGVKRLIAFSSNEVLRGSAGLEREVRYFEDVLTKRFDQTFADQD